MLTAFVDVSGWALAYNACNTTNFGAKRQIASPGRGVDAGTLLDDDNISRLRHLDCRRAEMLRGGWPAIINCELHCDHRSGNLSLGRILMNARHHATESEFVHRVGNGACVEAV